MVSSVAGWSFLERACARKRLVPKGLFIKTTSVTTHQPCYLVIVFKRTVDVE